MANSHIGLKQAGKVAEQAAVPYRVGILGGTHMRVRWKEWSVTSFPGTDRDHSVLLNALTSDSGALSEFVELQS